MFAIRFNEDRLNRINLKTDLANWECIWSNDRALTKDEIIIENRVRIEKAEGIDKLM